MTTSQAPSDDLQERSEPRKIERGMRAGLMQRKPLHEQMYWMIRERIANGCWRDAHSLPGEVCLSQELGVSVGTIRKAMERLARENIVSRAPGRGTFVRAASQWCSPWTFSPIPALVRAEGCEVELVAIESVPLTPTEEQYMRVGRGRKPPTRGLRIARKWKCGGVLVCQETIIASETILPNFHDFVKTDPLKLYGFYEEAYRISIASVNWQIRPASASRGQSKCILHIERRSYDEKELLIEVCEQKLLPTCIGLQMSYRA